jgi:hypothetical protein
MGECLCDNVIDYACRDHRTTYIGWPGRWYRGRLNDDGGLPVHLYPMPVDIKGQGPLDDSDPNAFRMVCWCSFPACVGSEDQFGFPNAQ